MQTIAKYKETVIFVSCATVLVGTVLALQKATTPSRHRRRAASSASRAGTAVRSASHGAAGTRSRSSSRPRVSHTTHAHGNTVAAATSAAGRSHTSKSREHSQAHVHRHHSHSRNSAAGGAAQRGEDTDAAPAAKLTVDAVTQHKKTLGTASALQKPGHTGNTGGAAPARRGVSSSGYRVHSGSGSGEEGVYYRSASNAATVGSHAPYPPPLPSGVAEEVERTSTTPAAAAAGRTTVEALHSTRQLGEAVRTARVEKQEHTAPAQASPATVATHDGAPAPAAATLSATQVTCAAPPVAATTAGGAVVASTTQTEPRWFCEDRGTQTEASALHDARRAVASGTPDRWLEAAMMSPILAAEEGTNTSMPMPCADGGWTPLREAAGVNGGGESAAASEIPRYLLTQLEAQVRLLVEDVAQGEQDERGWMRLYEYLSELPLPARRCLVERNRCGAATVAPLVDKAVASLLSEGNQVEEAVAAPCRVTELDCVPSLPREVLHLMHHGTPTDRSFHFQWQGCAAAYVEGPFPGTAADADNTVPERRVSSSLFPDEAADDAAESQTSRMLACVAAHIRRYSSLTQHGVATQFPEPVAEGLRTPRGATQAIEVGPYALSTPPSTHRRDADAAVTQRLRDQQTQLTALLASFVQLRQTPLFQGLRHTPEHAMFACDFMELSSAAERLLDRVTPPRDLTVALPQPPMTQKRVVAEAADVHSASVGTSASGDSGSSPLASHQERVGGKARTPMKPSVRYPIQRLLSASPSPTGLSSRRSSEAQNVYERLSTPPVHVGEEEPPRAVRRGGSGGSAIAATGAAVAYPRSSRRVSETWVS
ncbi:hypothetical protein NESM_000024100 [Novymonas esmeraldas]|uniref:GPI-anchored surface protein n=1 Tax=Novymonas esmeraldas TaxID=1808958 RepID=A0AAW0F1S5_9TRYP